MLLDIGSGQGQFAIDLQRRHPDVERLRCRVQRRGRPPGQRAGRRARGWPRRFLERNLLEPATLADGSAAATHAVCSEVLEHVDDPTTLMRNATQPARPGLPRSWSRCRADRASAFDKHIGHYRHFTADAAARRCSPTPGFDVDRVLRAGFPFFNLYKLAVIARGKRLIADVERREPGARPSRASR